ncbi:MAG: hypothetical protein Q9220_001310 [cf. Caloplaca sp. 1 TL-2023]
MTHGPSATTAGSTTQHVQWTSPAPTPRPGSVGMPDAPIATSPSTTRVDPPVDPRPKPVQPNIPDPNVAEAHPIDNPPAQDPPSPANTAAVVAPAGDEPSSSSPASDKNTPNQQPQVPNSPSSKDPVDPASLDPPPQPDSPGSQSMPGPVLVAGQPIAAVNTDPLYHVGGQTLVPGGSAVTVNGIPFSLAPSASALVSGAKTIAIAQPTPKLPPLNINGNTYTANEASQYIVGSKTLLPNGSPVTFNNAVYSIAPSATAVISNGHTIQLATPLPNHPTLIIGGQSISPDTRPRLTISNHEIIGGGPVVTINQTPYALDPSGTALQVGSSTIAVSALPTSNTKSGTPNNPIFSNIPLVVGSQTTHLPSPQNPQDGLVVTINSTPYTAIISSSIILLASQTLHPGGPAITINGTPISLDLPSSPTTTTNNTNFAILTLASNNTYTCYQSSPACVIANQTLTPNGTITVGAETVRYGSQGIDVVSAQVTTVGGGWQVSEGEVITSHISGLTPLVEVSPPTASATGTGDGKGEGKKSAVAGRGGVEWWFLWWVAWVFVGMVRLVL